MYVHPDFANDKVVEFSELAVGDNFLFATKKKEGQRHYTKEEERRSEYGPESHRNASFLWKNINDRGEVISEGKTFFYVNKFTEVLKK